MKKLTFAKGIKDFQFILVLVDYNQNSTSLALDNIRKLPFADQIKVFYTGFGMWKDNVKPI
jgi:predicted O-methyltransferase YrrM